MDFSASIFVFFLLVLIANFTYSLYSLVIQIQTKDTVKDSWGWITLRVIGLVGAIRMVYILVTNSFRK